LSLAERGELVDTAAACSEPRIGGAGDEPDRETQPNHRDDAAAAREVIRNQHYDQYRSQAGKGCLGPTAALIVVLYTLAYAVQPIFR